MESDNNLKISSTSWEPIYTSALFSSSSNVKDKKEDPIHGGKEMISDLPRWV